MINIVSCDENSEKEKEKNIQYCVSARCNREKDIEVVEKNEKSKVCVRIDDLEKKYPFNIKTRCSTTLPRPFYQ